jgi:hypothetical protein
MVPFVIAVALCVVRVEPGDCGDCAPQKLCANHLSEEQAALKAAAPELKSKDEATRIKALEKIAALKDSHENAPSAAAANALASGLTDASWQVRIATVKLLAKGQDHDTAVEELSKSFTDSRKDGVKWMTFASRSGMTAEQKTFAEYMKVTAEALAGLKDERAAKALIEFLKKATGPMPEEMILPVIQAAGSLGTLPAFEIVVDRLAQSEGFGMGGSRAYHEVLVKTATAHGGKELPEWGQGTAGKWKKWLDAHRSLFPAKVAA